MNCCSRLTAVARVGRAERQLLPKRDVEVPAKGDATDNSEADVVIASEGRAARRLLAALEPGLNDRGGQIQVTRRQTAVVRLLALLICRMSRIILAFGSLGSVAAPAGVLALVGVNQVLGPRTVPAVAGRRRCKRLVRYDAG